MSHYVFLFFCLSGLSKAAGGATYAVPPAAPTDSAVLGPAPVGVSFEFGAFPSYFTELKAETDQCLLNLATMTGTFPPLRIGGASQDRATYNASYTASPIAPLVPMHPGVGATLQFGPSFMALAGTYKGTVVLGLNRALNDLPNTVAAAEAAKDSMSNLLAIELGNEPDLYLQEKEPIAEAAGAWDPAIDAESENEWDVSVGQAISTEQIIQAGNFAYEPTIWGAAELIGAENSTVKSYVNDYSHHNYPGGVLINLMSHPNIVKNIARHSTSVEAAASVGKDYVLGETNSVAGGGSAAVSPTFGAALWTMDYALRAATTGIARIYFHHGDPTGHCYYCWWSTLDIRNPYYGGYVATAAMSGGSHIIALDPGTTQDAVYVIYDAHSRPYRALIYNSEYYSGSGARPFDTIVLTGLTESTDVKAMRLTAPSALSMRSQGEKPSWAGQQFEDQTCVLTGKEILESTPVVDGSAEFNVSASEALMVFL